MDSKVNYTIVGIFVCVLGAALLLIGLWLTSLKHTEKYQYYVTYMREEVAGLNVQSAVRFNGVKVGYVSAIDLNAKDPQQVKITLAISQETFISTSTIAVLQSEGITGIDYIGLKALTISAPALKAQKGEQYPVIPSEPSLLVKLSTSLQEVTDSIKILSEDVNKVFDEKNRQALQQSLQSLAKVTQTIADNSKQIDASLKSANVLLKNSALASKKLPQVMVDMQSTLKSIRTTSDNFNKTNGKISQAMNNTSQAVNDLSQQLLPSAEQLINRLNNIAGNVEHISSDMQQNPSILVRGKYPAPPGPGER